MESEAQAPTSKRYAVERRSTERRPLRLVARLAHPTGILYGNLENISRTGASFVTTSLEPELEAETDVVLILISPPSAITEEVHCTARIVRVEDFVSEEHATLSYGLRFDEGLSLDVVVGAD